MYGAFAYGTAYYAQAGVMAVVPIAPVAHVGGGGIEPDLHRALRRLRDRKRPDPLEVDDFALLRAFGLID